MRKIRIYLDSTIPGAYYDERTSDRQQHTREFWHNQIPACETFISEIVLLEIQNTPEVELQTKFEELVDDFPVLYLTKNADDLTDLLPRINSWGSGVEQRMLD